MSSTRLLGCLFLCSYSSYKVIWRTVQPFREGAIYISDASIPSCFNENEHLSESFCLTAGCVPWLLDLDLFLLGVTKYKENCPVSLTKDHILTPCTCLEIECPASTRWIQEYGVSYVDSVTTFLHHFLPLTNHLPFASILPSFLPLWYFWVREAHT